MDSKFIKPGHLTDIHKICEYLNISYTEFKNFFELYNNNMQSYGNEIYCHKQIRAVHWWNFLEQGWFNKRLEWYLENASSFDAVLDVGFSVPYPYEVLRLLNSSTHYLFIDKYDSSLEFYNILSRASQRIAKRKNQDEVLVHDLQSNDITNISLKILKKWSPQKLLISAIEIVEHLEQPERFWSFCYSIQKEFQNLIIYVTLPIGEKIPSHHLAFASESEASKYVKKYIQIQEKRFFPIPENHYMSNFFLGSACFTGKLKT